jgi:uncharacterized membrane protein YraQ (UPF0718 family)
MMREGVRIALNMDNKGRKSSMLIPTVIMGVVAMAFVFVGYSRGQGEHLAGLKSALTMTGSIMPLLIAAFVIAGMVQVLLPQEVVSRWVGTESGIRGILIGTVAGGITPGGPYVSLPVVAGLLHAGAGIGTMVAFLTGWSLWALSRLPLELGILGWKLTLIRFGCTFFFPPIAGLIAQALFGNTRWM